MKPTFVSCLIVAATLAAMPAQAQMNFFPEELIVNASILNLRDRPDLSGKVVEKLPRGAALTLVEIVNEGQFVEVDSVFGAWLKVQYKNKNGYVFSPHVTGKYNLYQDGDFFNDALPDMNWYGVYVRDSFADEMRKIEVRLVEEYSDFFMENMKILKTNQKDTAKFIIGSATPLRPGFAGNLGLFDPGSVYLSNDLAPGAMLPVFAGQEPDDTTVTPTYFLAAVGCAQFESSDYVQVSGYRLYVLELNTDTPAVRQDITGWVQPAEGMSPTVRLIWYGDLDSDRKPDVLLQDSPYEAGARLSLFLSSKARPGEYLHKVCEYFYPID